MFLIARLLSVTIVSRRNPGLERRKWAHFSLYTNYKKCALYIPGALFAILLKQVVKTSYKCCIGSSSLAAILGTRHYWQDKTQPLRQPIVSNLSKQERAIWNACDLPPKYETGKFFIGFNNLAWQWGMRRL